MREIAVFFTGGTIGMSPAEAAGGVAPGGNFGAFLDELRPLPAGVRLRPTQWSDMPSPHMTPEHMLRLLKDVDAALRTPETAGAVVLHGTDTLVETAYLFELALESSKPVVLTGSMRYYSESGYDGVRNLVNGVRACLLPLPPAVNVALLMTDRLFAPREAVKVNSLNIDAFESREAGVIGYVAGESVLLASPADCRTPRQGLYLQALEPNVALIGCYTGMDDSPLRCMLEQGVAGVVLEAFGAGNVPPGALPGVDACLRAGVPVVLSTRCIEGGVWPIYSYSGGAADLQRRGVILSGRLGAQKARIKLMAGLGAGMDRDGLRRFFESDAQA